MDLKLLKTFFLVFVVVFCAVSTSYAQDSKMEGHIVVSMRMIGHQLLLKAGDSTSRVLAIEKEEDKYGIRFSSDFYFDPRDLTAVIDSVINKTAITNHYLVEVEECKSKKVIYSYEVDKIKGNDMAACFGRVLPKACYSLFITILERPKPIETTEAGFPSVLIIVLVLLILALGFYYGKRQNKEVVQTNIINIGNYAFDKQNMTLSFENNKTELSSKEADLLDLLHSSANKTLEREHILNVVWGDKGDYVGRTLDVFISKLRKKLEADSRIKITNIRGIGYRMVLNT